MGDDGWGAASDNWPGHCVSSEQNSSAPEVPLRTAEVTARCMVELYELQSGVLDRERQVVQPLADQVSPSRSFVAAASATRFIHDLQGVGFGWLNNTSALLAFRTSELAAIAVRSSGRETCLYVPCIPVLSVKIASHSLQGTSSGIWLTAASLPAPCLPMCGPSRDA
jgi:hypothetical protein